MKNKIKEIFKYKDNKILLSNFLSLSSLQVANFILPLLTIPYLIRVLGLDLYGLLAFATAMTMYFIVLSDYGFNLTGTREISIHRDSRHKVIEIFSAIFIIKILLMLLGLIILSAAIFLFEKLQKDWIIYYLTFGMVIGQVLFPVWFFQGMEKMKYISVLNLIAKIFFILSIFIFVKSKSDYYLVPLFNSLSFIFVGLISLYYIRKEFNISLQWQKIGTLGFYLKDGWHVFVSSIAHILYTSSNVFILGIFSNNTTVGYYSIAEKVIGAVASIGSIINRVVFPYLSRIWKNNKDDYYLKFRYCFSIITVVMSIAALGIFIYAPYIINFLSNESLNDSIKILEILAITIVLVPLGGLFTQSFVTTNRSKYVTKSTIYTMIINMSLVFLLIKYYGIYGLSVTVLLVQIFHLSINIKYFFMIKRKNSCVE